jgi:hypothetical protein
MDTKEAKAMQGTEFIYITGDGTEIKSYVKVFDERIGMTCFSLEPADEEMETWGMGIEEDGTFCVVGYNFSNERHTLDDCFRDLEIIRDTGRFCPSEITNESETCGIANCAF